MTEYLDVHDTIDMKIYKEITNRCDICKELTFSQWSYCKDCYLELAGYKEKYTAEDKNKDIRNEIKKAHQYEDNFTK